MPGPEKPKPWENTDVDAIASAILNHADLLNEDEASSSQDDLHSVIEQLKKKAGREAPSVQVNVGVALQPSSPPAENLVVLEAPALAAPSQTLEEPREPEPEETPAYAFPRSGFPGTTCDWSEVAPDPDSVAEDVGTLGLLTPILD